MARPLDASHFKVPPRPDVSALPGIPKLAARLADGFAQGLAALRAAPWQVTLDGVTEGAAPLADAEAALLRFESDRGSLTTAMFLDRSAISALLEAAMGGTGAEPAFAMSERPLSKIETRVLQHAQATLAASLAEALGDVLARPFGLFDGTDVPGFPEGCPTARFRFVLNIFSYSGEVYLVFARDELERQLMAAGADQTTDMASARTQILQEEVGRSEVMLTVTLGPEMLPLDVIAGLRPGKLIALSATADMPVTVWSGGVAAYKAALGRSGDRFAITISQAMC